MMRKLALTIILLIPVMICAQTPLFDGAIILDGTQNSAHYNTNCFADNNGILHISGQFAGVCDFDPGPNIVSLSANNGYPCYVARYNNNLELIWAKLLIGNGDSTGVQSTKVLSDMNGNTLVAGFHNNTFDADPGPNVHTLPGFPFTYSAFILSLNDNGNYNWSAQFGNASNHCRIYDMVETSNGHLFFCGDFNDSIDFDPSSNIQLKVAADNTSGSFLLELDSNGNFISVLTWDNLDVLRCIDRDESDNIYLGGAYQGTTDFDPGVGNYILNSSFASLTGIVISVDTTGNFRWASNFIDVGSITNSVVKDIAYANNIIAVTGHFNNSIDIDPGVGIQNISAVGNYDHFHVGLGSNIGNLVWGGRTGGNQVDDIRAMCADDNGDFWIHGISQGNADLDLDPNEAATYFFGSNAVPWIMRISNNGDLLWSGTQGGYFLNGNYENSISTHKGAIYWMGNIGGNMNLDPIGNSYFTSPNDYYSGHITKLCLPVESTTEISLCPGDSIYVQNAWQTLAGVYTDVYQRINGCDSTVNTVIYEANLNISLGNDTAFCNSQLFLSINNAPAMNFLWSNGDPTSYLFVDSTGTYSVTVSSTNGACSASDTINVIYGLEVNVPNVNTPICLNAGTTILPDGNPSGGTWTGAGVNSNIFDPLVAGIGNYWLYYNYTDTLGCSGIDSTYVVVDLCVGTENSTLNGIKLFPNPAKEKIKLLGYYNDMSFELFDLYGNKLPLLPDKSGELNINHIANGVYFIQIKNTNGQSQFLKFIKTI